MDNTILNIIFKNAKSSNMLFGKTCRSLIYHSYGVVKEQIPFYLKSFEYEKVIALLYPKQKNKIKRLQPHEFIPFILWVRDELEQIYNLEKTYLSSTPDIDLLNAGIKRLDELGEITIIDNLAGGDVLKWDKIRNLPYEVVFTKLRKNTLEAQINKDYHRILSNKNK